MKTFSLAPPICALALLTAALLAVSATAQAPQVPATQAQPADHDHSHPMPAPTNLKVLPKNLTGDEVHEIMETWEGGLGVHCSTCHTADPKNIGPNGRPRLNFADDSKQEKATARMMYTMTEDINKNYVSKVPGSETPVTCGTCHRGHMGPEPFVIPPDDHDKPHQPAPATPPAAK